MNNLLAIPTYIETGMFKIATIDILVFAILAVALIIGYAKGFMKQILSILGFFAGTVLAIIFCDNLADFIYDKMPALTNSVRGSVESTLGSALGGVLSNEESLLVALSQSKIPVFLHDIILNFIANSGYTVKIIDVVTIWALTAISYVVIFVVSLIVFFFVKKFLSFFTELPLIKTVDKVLGMLFSALKALAVLVIIFTILSLFTNINVYLVPEDGVVSTFNKIIEGVMNIPFLKNLIN